MNNNCKKILFYCIAAAVVFAPIARGTVRLWSVTPVLLALYFLIFIWLWSGVLSFKKTPLDAFIFLFVALAVISCVFSINKYESFNAILRILAYVGLYYVVLNNFDVMMRDRFFGLVVGLGTALSLYGLLQYFGKLGHSWWLPPEFLSATYVNHNHFAGFLELVIPVAVGSLVSCPTERFYRSLGLGLVIIILLAAFALAQSRAGWLSLGVSLVAMGIVLIRKRRRVQKNIFVFFMIASVILGFAYAYRGLLSKPIIKAAAFVEGEEEPSLGSRLKIWQATLQMARDNPLIGVGIGAFDSGFYRYRPRGLGTRAVYAHNDYLHMAAEMGVLAPLIMIGFLLVLLKAGARRGVDFRVLGCGIGILSLALHGMADFNFHIPANMLLLTVYAAFIMTADTKE